MQLKKKAKQTIFIIYSFQNKCIFSCMMLFQNSILGKSELFMTVLNTFYIVSMACDARLLSLTLGIYI